MSKLVPLDASTSRSGSNFTTRRHKSPIRSNAAVTLITETTSKKFDLAKYKDTYREELTKLIEAKVAGQEIVAPPAAAQPQVINLMDALRQSVEKAKESGAETKPPRKMAPSTRDRTKELRKKSS